MLELFIENLYQSYGASPAVWDHTLLRCHPTQVNAPCLNLNQMGWYSIYLPRKDEKLSWPRRLVIYRDGLPARRQSPVKVLTQHGVE